MLSDHVKIMTKRMTKAGLQSIMSSYYYIIICGGSLKTDLP